MILTLLLLLLSVAMAGPRLIPEGAVDGAEAEAAFHGRRFALLVGPAFYEDASFAPLRYTSADARALGAVLADPGAGRFDRVWVLDADADLGAVMTAMDKLAAESRSADDTVFVYFSTHGTLALDARGDPSQYLVLSDTRLAHVQETGLSHARLGAWLESLPSRKKVLLLATCHSGRGKSAWSPEVAARMAGVKGALPPLREVSEAIVVIGVCAWDEAARESEELGHDIYTWFFLEALREADSDGDGAVTVTEAHDHARVRTYAYTEGAQRPYAQVEVLGTDPIVLTGERVRPGRPSVASYHPGLDGYEVRVDGQTKGVLPGQMVVEPGRHKVELASPETGRVVARSVVDLEEGAVELEDLVRHDRLRVGVGVGWQGYGPPVPASASLLGELHLPLSPTWELIAHGETAARWPRPVLSGGVVVERVLRPGELQLRAGLGLEGFVLQASGEPPLLAPSLVPMPALALMWLPPEPIYVRLAATGGGLWYTDGGALHGDWALRVGLTIGSGW